MPQHQTTPSLLAKPSLSDHRIYPTLFSPNGAFLAAASQDFALRVFRYPPPLPSSATEPLPLDLHATFTLPSRGRQWTVTDATIDDASAHIAFCTLASSRIAFAPLTSESATPRALSIPTGPVWRNPLGHAGTTADLSRWGMLSLRFMHGVNKDKLVAGLTDAGIAVVDVCAALSAADDTALSADLSESAVAIADAECNVRGVRKISGAHADDVNAVQPLSAAQAELVLSGGDDGLGKMWDLRTDAGAAVGVLRGHRAGITSLDVTEDGRGAVSVGKDQCVKVWDLRRMDGPAVSLVEEKDERDGEDVCFDYRFQECPAELLVQAADDTSQRTLTDCQLHEMDGDEDDDTPEQDMPTFKVSNTLIKARYWPADERFVAAGSADGRIRVWNAHTGELVRRWDVDSIQDEAAFGGSLAAIQTGNEIDHMMQPRHSEERMRRTAWVVRDVTWHPTEPVLAASWWGNRRATGWKGGAAHGGLSVYGLEGCLGEDEDWVNVS